MPKNHEPTAAEAKRVRQFEQKKHTLLEAGYTCTPMTMSMEQAGRDAFKVMLPVILPFLFLYGLVLGMRGAWPAVPGSLFLWLLAALPILLVLIVLHEGIHGLIWGAVSPGGYRSIEFGIIWKYLTPYCTCTEPLKRHQYIIGALMPTVLLGIVPALWATFNNHPPVLIIGHLMILSGAGDVLVIRELLRHRQSETTIYMDHPSELGLVVFENQNIE